MRIHAQSAHRFPCGSAPFAVAAQTVTQLDAVTRLAPLECVPCPQETTNDPGIDARQSFERRVIQVHDVGRVTKRPHPQLAISIRPCPRAEQRTAMPAA